MTRTRAVPSRQQRCAELAFDRRCAVAGRCGILEVAVRLACCQRPADLNLYNKLATHLEDAADGANEIASTLASAGVSVARQNMEDRHQRALDSIIANVRAKFGAAPISVAQSDPSYPLFKSQQQFQVGVT